MQTPILGSCYVARSVNAASNRMVNLFPEIIPEGGKETAFLSRAPGITLLTTVGTGPVRGMWVVGGFLYVVSGTMLYKIIPNYSATIVGSVSNTDGSPISMSDDGLQLFVASNGNGYLLNTQTLAFTQINDPGFQGAGTVAYFDGRFVWNEPGTQTIRCANLPDGAGYITFDAALEASAEGSPDNVVGIIVDHRELWVFGESSTEVWYDEAAGSGFPFTPIQGVFSEIGCAAADSIAKLDNTVFWLSRDARGHGVVYRANGYTGVRISTHAVEWHIQQYGDLSNAIAYTYQQDGHAFYVLTFPNAAETWVYDVATQAWHERAGFNSPSFTRHRSNCQVFFNNVNIVGDFANGNLYKFDLTNFADGPFPNKWLRSWRALPPGQNDLNRAAHHSLQLDCETGVGLVSGQGADPQIILRWSDDGGHTWSNEHWCSMGAIGDFSARVIWRRLGMTMKIRDRVYEVSGTDPVKITILGAELHVIQTNA
jgi:hypothetical protein